MIIAIIILSLAVIGLAGWCGWLAVNVEFHESRAENLERWAHGVLYEIRTDCGFASPQALSVISSLECALPILGPVDTHALRRDLVRIQAERDAMATENTKHWCAVQVAVAEEASKGAALPGMESLSAVGSAKEDAP